MQTAIIICRYKKRYILFALMSMALFRIPLSFNKNILFYKLMGSGKNGSFSKTPDWQQWAILVELNTTVNPNLTLTQLLKQVTGKRIFNWLRFFNCETCLFILEPVHSRGLWDGKKRFIATTHKMEPNEKIAVLTRATIRLNRLKVFWKHVDAVNKEMLASDGYIMSYGIGEWPLVRQATFSIWQSQEKMMQFAYKNKNHTAVITKTRDEKWYSEDLFARFKIILCMGTLNGENPLQVKNLNL